MKTTSEIMKIAGSGGGLIIDGKKKTTSEIMKIVSMTKSNNAPITVKNASSKTTSELMKIARMNPGIVTFDLTE